MDVESYFYVMVHSVLLFIIVTDILKFSNFFYHALYLNGSRMVYTLILHI